MAENTDTRKGARPSPKMASDVLQMSATPCAVRSCAKLTQLLL